MLTPPEELALHMAKINGVWVCTTCTSNFRDKTDCRRHVESKHVVGTVYRCTRCEFTTNTEAKFRKHDREHDRVARATALASLTPRAVGNPLLIGRDDDLPPDFDPEVPENLVDVEPEIVEPRFDIDIDDVNVDDV